ncbi:MAG: hypothetical protein Q8O64_00725 [Sideroxyarcus sp.]|nr:hypothetical protein [Sideroxyarcus sp.]
MNDEELKKHGALINQIGTPALITMFGISKGAISQWRHNGIPKARLMYLKVVRPELFVESTKPASSKQPPKEKL